MAVDLQATIEISVEFSTFHNVDLFQRGYYQIRCSLKPPDKAVSCIDVEYRSNNGDYQPDDCLYPAMVTPTGLTAVSKTFQILYRNEDIILSDPFIFRLSMLVDSNKVTEQIDQADVQLLVELFFSDSEVGPESPDSPVSVASQVLKLHLSCVKGLHHHVPVLFDYFHFAIIDTTIHAMLVKLSLPDPSILKMPKSSSWFSKNASNSRLSTPLFYSKLFGNKPLSNVLNSRTPAEERQIRFAYDTHRSLCSTLLSAQVNLLAYFECLTEYLPTSQQIQIGSLDFGERLDSLMMTIESIQNSNEVFSQICSDLDNVSMEVSLVWSQFIESFTLNKQILPHFREEHHRQRVGHFSEAFFLQDFTWDELQIHQEQSFQLHQSLGQGIKSSRYYQTIPSVAVECPCLDGDTSSTPIIFEDKYSFTTPEREEAPGKSDLEDIDFTLDDADGCQDENDGDDDELVIIETDLSDTPASQDDPNSSFALSGILCNGGRPVRETMILDDDLEIENNDLSKVLDEIHRLEDHPSTSGRKNDEHTKLSPCDNISGNDCKPGEGKEEGSYTAPEGLAVRAERNANEQNANLFSVTDVISGAAFFEDTREDESFLMDLSLQKALIEQFESQKSKDKSEDKIDKETEQDIDNVNTTSTELLQCSGNENNESSGSENSNLNKATDSEFDIIQQTVQLQSDIPSSGHQDEVDNNNIVSNEEVQVSFEETQDEIDAHENTSDENEGSEQGTQEAQIEEDENDTNIKEKECLDSNQVVDSPLHGTSSSADDGDVEVIQEEGHSDNLSQSESSSVDNNQCNDSVSGVLPCGTVPSNDAVSLVSNNEEPAPSTESLVVVPSGSEEETDEPSSSNSSENAGELPGTKKESNEPSSSNTNENVGEPGTKEESFEPSSSNSSEFVVEPGAKRETGELSSSNTNEIAEEPGAKDVNPNPGSVTQDSDTMALQDTVPSFKAPYDSNSDDNLKDSTKTTGDIPDVDKKESNSSENISNLEQSTNDVSFSSTQEVLATSSTDDHEHTKTSHDQTHPLDRKKEDVINLKPSSSEVTFLNAHKATSSDSIVSDSHSDGSVYETPSSSQATISPSGSHTEVTSNTDGPKPAQQQKLQQEKEEKVKKIKKKVHPKGLGITGCLPVSTCAGNSSPSFSRGSSSYGGSVKSRFELAKRFVKRQLKFSFQIYSDIGLNAEREAYFSKDRPDSVETHLIICVHGLDGNSGDLRLFRCYLEMALPSTRIDFLMSEVNQGDTFVSFEELTDRLVQEIRHYIDAYSIFPSKISFVGHSLGNIIIRSALSHPDLRPLLDRMHTLLSLSGPHVGMLYPTSPLVSTGLWLMQKWKKSEALTQLSLNDHEDLRQTCIYRLSQSKGFEYFKNVLLVSSVQDHYVPYHSARIEMCKAAARDTSEYGTVYREMISNLISPLKDKKNMTFIRYSCYHALTSSANSFIGRAAHIAMLDSELFIEKLLLVSALDYFR